MNELLKELRRIGILIGSESDLSQSVEGNAYLIEQVATGNAIVYGIDPASQHRRTLTVQSILTEYARRPIEKRIHVLITGAGWANHLSACSDAFLRYTLQDSGIVVIGVGFEDKNNIAHTKAAVTSTSEVPGTQVIYKDDEGNALSGPSGYLWACKFAVSGKLPEVKAKTPPPYRRLTLEEAYNIGLQQKAKGV